MIFSGILGNLFVVVVILASSLKARINNMLIVHQALIDILVSIMLIASSTITTYRMRQGMPAAEAYCSIWLTKSLLWATMTVSTYSLVVISFERCLSMVLPIWHKVSQHNCQRVAI